MPTPTLNTERLVLRPLDASDHGLIDALYGDERVTSGFGYPAYSPEQLAAKQEQLLGAWAIDGFSQFAVLDRSSGQPTGLGGIRPTAHQRVGEIGYVFLPGWWGQGLASEAIKAWTEWGFSDLDLERIIADGVENPASIRALEKANYTIVRHSDVTGRRLVDLAIEPIPTS